MSQTRTQVLDLLDRHGLHTRKVLGQHFLADPNLIRKMVAVAGVVSGDRVVEIGVGTGNLTSELAETGATVLGIEIDERLRPLHEEVFASHPNVTVRYADAARLDLGSILPAGPWKLVANLPYNVGTGILLDVLRRAPQVTLAVVMLQAEVVERLIARPGSRAYGVPSVIAQLNARMRTEFRVPPQVFIPPPRVWSAVVSAERISPSRFSERAIELAGRAFRSRRKMIRSTLGAEMAVAAGISPDLRPEQLGPEDFLRLAAVADV